MCPSAVVIQPLLYIRSPGESLFQKWRVVGGAVGPIESESQRSFELCFKVPRWCGYTAKGKSHCLWLSSPRQFLISKEDGRKEVHNSHRVRLLSKTQRKTQIPILFRSEPIINSNVAKRHFAMMMSLKQGSQNHWQLLFPWLLSPHKETIRQ